MRWAVLLLLAPVALGRDEIPFPVRKSTTASKDGATYVVEGRQRIGPGVRIVVKQNTRIEGRGENPTLEVAGTLILAGQPKQEIEVANLRIEPAQQFHEIRIEWTKMNARIETPEEGSAAGTLTIDSTATTGPIHVAFRDGTIRFVNSELRAPVTLLGAPDEGKSTSNVQIRLLGCSGSHTQEGLDLSCGFFGGLRVVGAPDVLVRANWLTGGAYDFEDCGKLMLDGNTLVGAYHLLVRQTAPGRLKRTRVSKCDFHGVELLLQAPRSEKPEKVLVDKCWFGGTTDKSRVLAEAVRDGTRDETSGAYALFRKINKRPLGIGGTPRK